MNKNFNILDDFHPVVAEWFRKSFSGPSPPQVQGWPAIASGNHTLILAPTGSGKTLASFLWCIDNVFRKGLESDRSDFAANRDGVHTLYISPLKALNNDIHTNLQVPLSGIRKTALEQGLDPPDIRTAVRTGDTPSHVRQSMVKKPPHILITTPESLYLLLTSERGREMFGNLKYVIIDEIHSLSNNKRGTHMSLSLERLEALCKTPPVRIGLSATQRPLERIAAFLGGQVYNPGTDSFAPRPVTIVDCGQRKELDLKVISPVKDFNDLPDSTIWPALIDTLYNLILAHETTLVFVNMRAQAEKIARQINEKHAENAGGMDGPIALSHHGSISREMRYDIESTLKKGEIPAVIATSSLELGIDIGSIDLVVQVETPKTVASTLQRVGRSGHLLSATSKGRIIPLYQSDLDDAVAFIRFMREGEIEETHIPENGLDVLAQQIVAEVSMREWQRIDLYRLLRGSYSYRNLTETVFNNIVDMLNGRFGHTELRALQPRLTWDTVNDRLITRRGSRLTAVMNGGTIADRAYFGVYLQDSGTRIGEMEEEFAFESRVGDVFFLGNNEWRINEITKDRIIVSPLGSPTPRPPFWKSEPLYRDFETSSKIGSWREQVLSYLKKPDELAHDFDLDADTAENVLDYLKRQFEQTGELPTDKRIVIEYFRDSVGEPQVVIHGPYGGKVLGAWATVLCAVLEKRFDVQVQYSYDDDSILIRLLDVTEHPDMEALLKITADEAEEILTAYIPTTPLFAIRFRHNATRALLLQRSRADMRIPLWLQRLRASDLLQVVQEFPDFPIIIETMRDCLQDVFDVAGMKKVINDIHEKSIAVHTVHTSSPSPMASGVLFRLLAEYMYEYDQTRTTGFAAEISSDLLADVLQKEVIPAIVGREIIDEAESRWQHIAADSRAKDAEDLFSIIQKLGPLTDTDLTDRSAMDPDEWIVNLQQQKRIYKIDKGWITIQEKNYYEYPQEPEHCKWIVNKIFRGRGPLLIIEIVEQTKLDKNAVTAAVESLVKDKVLVSGTLVENEIGTFYCDRHNFAQLYRRAIVIRRQAMRPGDRNLFYRFLLNWHRIHKADTSVDEIVRQYSGLYLPTGVFERDILRSRLINDTDHVDVLVDFVNSFMNSGDIHIRAQKERAGTQTRVCYTSRGEGSILKASAEIRETADDIKGEEAQTVLLFLRDNGASHFKDICDGSGLSQVQTENGLYELALSGLVSCDHYSSFLRIIGRTVKNEEKTVSSGWHDEIKPAFPRGPVTRHGRRAQRPSRHEIRSRLPRYEGRWTLTTAFAVHGKELEDDARAEKQARLLLQRYGVLVKEFYRRESGLMPWYRIFRALKRMEWSGEIRRGYFIEGLSGVQFALPEAVRKLESLQTGEAKTSTGPALLTAVDPALPFGGTIDWGLTDLAGKSISVTRLPSNHLCFVDDRPVVYSENYGARLFLCSEFKPEYTDELAQALKLFLKLPEMYRPKRKLEIQTIDGNPAAEHELAKVFLNYGYEVDSKTLVLWPSGV